MKKKCIGAESETPPSPQNLAIDALIGEEEQKRKQKEEKKKNRERFPNPATLDHLIASYDPQESYSEPILSTP